MLVFRACATCEKFQSTQPKRAATYVKSISYRDAIFQSTQPEWAATRIFSLLVLLYAISIHAARVGCDGRLFTASKPRYISIHAARVGCDINRLASILYQDISIHAARVGCDNLQFHRRLNHRHFNPRSPSGLRPSSGVVPNQVLPFQSTQPKRAATFFKR